MDDLERVFEKALNYITFLYTSTGLMVGLVYTTELGITGLAQFINTALITVFWLPLVIAKYVITLI